MSWLGGTERVEIEPNADLRVVDRAFLHGDVVARAADALGAQGVAAAVHLDLDLIDYVAVHELSHLRQMNHGPEFWRVVASVLPDYERRRQALRRLRLAP